MILLSYDGSDDARTAIDRAAQLMPGADATVLTVWEPFIGMVTGTGSLGLGMGMGADYGDVDKIDEIAQQAALDTADEGAKHATVAGLVAQPRCASRQRGLANTILAVAEEVDADVVVMGTRGLSGVKSFLLGSVSHAVVQHADRAVLVVPTADIAQRRRDWVAHDALPA